MSSTGSAVRVEQIEGRLLVPSVPTVEDERFVMAASRMLSTAGAEDFVLDRADKLLRQRWTGDTSWAMFVPRLVLPNAEGQSFPEVALDAFRYTQAGNIGKVGLSAAMGRRVQTPDGSGGHFEPHEGVPEGLAWVTNSAQNMLHQAGVELSYSGRFEEN